MFADQTEACFLIQSEHQLHSLGITKGCMTTHTIGESPGEAALTGSKEKRF